MNMSGDVRKHLLSENRQTVIFAINSHVICDYLCQGDQRILLKMHPGLY